ncbi:hypothetical protein Q31b_39590 [Novipirellula aureliae]|uniref:Glycoside-hydrolase family GH114 TIM-barrel domain-containing protein n=1 Tax=Novipirellula aureliae TaxID=2527966 RepID=A0A5C6DTQ6_9BACT|nr:putative glycoside hydrolase [Novipirellula aureliae]TWU38881.1 hypothetical protein Q31b_39590 [Novipirellula aureliae]
MKALFIKKLATISIVLAWSIPALHAADGYPPFSWDTVPTYAHMANRSDDFTSEQLDFLAEHFDFITIEKGQATRKHGSMDKGFAIAAKGIKQRNPNAKVLFYLNSTIKIGGYEANERFPIDGELKSTEGERLTIFGSIPFFDLTQPEVRTWWEDTAHAAVRDLGADGIFIDAINKMNNANRRRVLTPQKIDALNTGILSMLKQTREKIGSSKLMIQNGVPQKADDPAAALLAVNDGAMDEHFVSSTKVNKEQLAADMEAFQKQAKAGKVMVCKTWPGFDWRDKELMGQPRAERSQLARERITFALACFLVVAEPYSYFCYTWGYQGDDTGTFEWYPELDKPLGPPKGDAQRIGWQYTREFAHAAVFVDIETGEARIDWK